MFSVFSVFYVHDQTSLLLLAVQADISLMINELNQINDVIVDQFVLKVSLCLSCQLDLSTLAKEQTHHLELQLEESRGHVVLLVTLTASQYVSIADLSLTPLDDPQERREIVKRYVS